MRGYIKINNSNEVIDFCAGDCILEGAIQIDISMEIIIDNPLSYKYINGEFVKNTDYKPSSETGKTVDQQINEIQIKIDELNNSVDLLVMNAL